MNSWRASTLLFLIFALEVGPIAQTSAKEWRTKEGCVYIDHPSNDGDSFRVKIGRRTYVIRLLWVDALETDNRYPDRVREQAEYFGITPQAALQIGREAARFTKEFLQKRPFTVYTQFIDAPSGGEKTREYAIVKCGETYLMEALVSNGLARIYGIQVMPPGGPSERRMRIRLRALEAEARQQRRGAWGLAASPQNPFEQLNRPPPIQPQIIRLERHVTLYSAEDAQRPLGTLRPGVEIRVLRAETAAMVRVRFTLEDGTVREGLLRRADLGI